MVSFTNNQNSNAYIHSTVVLVTYLPLPVSQRIPSLSATPLSVEGDWSPLTSDEGELFFSSYDTHILPSRGNNLGLYFKPTLEAAARQNT